MYSGSCSAHPVEKEERGRKRKIGRRGVGGKGEGGQDTRRGRRGGGGGVILKKHVKREEVFFSCVESWSGNWVRHSLC